MSSVNKVILVGRLGGDPEIRYTTGGSAVCNFSLATSEKYKDKNGDSKEKTEWHKIIAWNRLAEICGEYLAKGSLVYIEGGLTTRSWEDKEGKTRYTTEIVARSMQMLSTKNGNGNGGGRDNQDDEGEWDFSGAGEDVPF